MSAFVVPSRRLRRLGRAMLRAWGATEVAPGLCYRQIDRWGASLAERTMLARTLPGGARMWCDLREYVDRFTYFQGVFEPIEAWLFVRMLRPGMTVVDAGANIGQYTLLASRAVGRSGRVVAFEPMPPNIARLERHIRENGLDNVTLHRAALWDEPATLEFAQPPDHLDNAGGYGTGVVGAARYEKVPAVAFDDLAPPARVDLVKMDVEGSELRALHGMRRMLERDHPLLLIELNRAAAERAGSTLEELWDHLTERLGYRAWRIAATSAMSGEQTSVAGVAQVNVLCFHGDLPDPLREGWTYRDVLRWARSG